MYVILFMYLIDILQHLRNKMITYNF